MSQASDLMQQPSSAWAWSRIFLLSSPNQPGFNTQLHDVRNELLKKDQPVCSNLSSSDADHDNKRNDR